MNDTAAPATAAPPATETTLTLAGAQTIGTVQDTHARLLSALSGPGGLRLDLRDATGFDTAFVQLLLATRRHAARMGLGFALAAPVPEALAAVLAGGGFDAAEVLP